jgi:SAM-dependent methyltransferase
LKQALLRVEVSENRFAKMRHMADIHSRHDLSTVDDLFLGASETYGEAYFTSYHTGHGPVVYERSPMWLSLFATVADEIIRVFRPSTVLDAGCAIGLLVESLWDRGVRAQGIDVSRYAIAHARPDMRRYCHLGSLVDQIQGSFDLVTCIEVLEHLNPADAATAIANMCRVTDTILFSSTPSDFDEPTHVNICPPIVWIDLFAAQGFGPDFLIDGTFLAPHAMVFRKGNSCELTFQKAYALVNRYRMLSSERLEALTAERNATAAAQQARQHAESELAQARSGAQSEIAKVVSGAQDEIARVKAEAQDETARIRADARDEVARIRLDAQDEVAQIKLEGEAAIARQAQLRADAKEKILAFEEQFEAKAHLEAELRAVAQAALEAQMYAENEASAEVQRLAEAIAALQAQLQESVEARRRSDAQAGVQSELRSEALATLAAETKRYRTTVHELQLLLRDIHNSDSWRLTLPLRLAAITLRKAANRLRRGALLGTAGALR